MVVITTNFNFFLVITILFPVLDPILLLVFITGVHPVFNFSSNAHNLEGGNINNSRTSENCRATPYEQNLYLF